MSIRALMLVIVSMFALSPMAMAMAGERPDFLVDAAWLEERIEDPNLVVLEVRYYPHRYYTIGHIAGARQVQRFKDLGDNRATPIMRNPSRDAFQATLRDFGVNDDSLLVLYDDSRTALASRLYYLLDLYGYDMSRVKLLEGGTIDWEAFNDLTKEVPEVTPGTVTLKEADPQRFVEWERIYDDFHSRRDPSIVLLDARPHDLYTGERLSGAVRGGHLPGAINVVSLDGTDGMSQRWLSHETVAAMYRDIPRDATVYAYCHDGFRSTLAYMQLKWLGYRDVRIYNGGWIHWGNEQSLPVVEGEDPWDANHEL